MLWFLLIALCHSILLFILALVYEILYEKVYGVDHNIIRTTVDKVRQKQFNGVKSPQAQGQVGIANG